MENSKAFIIRKIQCQRKDKLIENGEIVKTEKGIAEVFNNFFGNIVKNRNISQYSDFDPIIENVRDPTLKAIL